MKIQNSIELMQLKNNYALKISPETISIAYTANEIDSYKVIVKDVNDWEEIHNYIINENEVDGIPNRKIECSNIEEYSLRSSVYIMCPDEAETLRSHPKIEDVILDPSQYPQPQSLCALRYNKKVSFNKPVITAAIGNSSLASTSYNNDVRSNWSHLFVNTLSSEPFRGVGISTTSTVNSDLIYSLTGKNVDCVIIDSGVTPLHPEFLNSDGSTRVKDIILDGPYKIDPEYFDSRGLTYTKIVDGVNLGVGISTSSAHSWWASPSNRSLQFSGIGYVTFNSLYTLAHTSTKTSNPNGNQLIDGHGTACASQVGGNSFGLATEANLWSIRILLGGAGGIIDASIALNICAIFHNAKKISQNGDPDPTLINNSYGFTSSTGNSSGVSYTHNYRGTVQSYTGNNNSLTPPTNSGPCRNHKYFTYNDGNGVYYTSYSGTGQYTPVNSGFTSNLGAENAISAGCIVVAAAGNQNQKFSDIDDIDYNNWYSSSSNYINRVGGVQKGGSNVESRKQGTIRVGALDCAVEPAGERQGEDKYSIRKVCYSNDGPMINVWAPAEMTMSAGYTNYYEDHIRNDDSNFYDTWFNGTSSASPNACSVIALYLQANRNANQNNVHEWLDRHGSREIDMSNPYSDPTEIGYWSQGYNSNTDYPDKLGDSYNLRGNGNLRGAPNKVLHNPYASGDPFFGSGIKIEGVSVLIN